MSNILRCIGSSIFVVRAVADDDIVNLVVRGISVVEDYLNFGTFKVCF